MPGGDPHIAGHRHTSSAARSETPTPGVMGMGDYTGRRSAGTFGRVGGKGAPMNPQSVYHAYAMSYIELDRAREEGKPVPASVLARLAGTDRQIVRAVMRALKDVERGHPLLSKPRLLALLARSMSVRVGG